MEAQGKFGYTPLLASAQRGHKDAVRILIKLGQEILKSRLCLPCSRSSHLFKKLCTLLAASTIFEENVSLCLA